VLRSSKRQVLLATFGTILLATAYISQKTATPKVGHFSRAFKFKQNPFNISPSPSLNFGFSSLERDGSLVGKGIKVTNLKVTVETTNHSNVICCDVWTFLGPAPFNFPEGSTTVREVNSYPWDINSLAPTHLELNIGRPGYNTGSFTYSVAYDFSTETAIVEPNMSYVIKSQRNASMDLPAGLYAQVLVWTGFTGANIDVNRITLSVEGTLSKNGS